MFNDASSVQDFVVVLDERGKNITSGGLAQLIAKVAPALRRRVLH